MGDAIISTVVAGDDSLAIEPFGLGHERELPGSVPEILALVPKLVALFEAGGDVACTFSGGRFVPDVSRTCAHCGARML